jgi:hypothetical protein
MTNRFGAAPTGRVQSEIVWSAVLGIVTVAIFFLWEGRQGFNLWDEGYLWYGVQRVIAGEVPIRDFQAYDPGRYYWSALLMQLVGARGIMAVRITVVILQAIAMASALGWLAWTSTKRGRGWYIAVCAVTLVVWMVPRHKVFDIAFSIGLVCVLASLARRPAGRNYFLAGAFVGLVAFFGRNHGIYGAGASIGMLIYLALRCDDLRQWWRGVALFIVGGFVGYLPMFVLMLCVPGFAAALVDSVTFLFQIKTTNLPLPVPWPWKARFGTVPAPVALRDLTLGLFFVSTLVFGALALAYVLIARWKRRPMTPLFVACAVCALPYAHYAFSRADAGHLAQGIFPTLVGLLVLAGTGSRWLKAAIAIPLCGMSVFTMLPMHPGWLCMGARYCDVVQVGGDRLRVDPVTKSDLALLQRLKHDFAPAGRSFFVAPLQPGAYAVLDGRSPTWENYTAWDRTEAFQREEIARLAESKPGFVLIFDLALDGREELRYSNTHALIDRYVRDHFIPVEGYSTNPDYRIYRAPGPISSPP